MRHSGHAGCRASVTRIAKSVKIVAIVLGIVLGVAGGQTAPPQKKAPVPEQEKFLRRLAKWLGIDPDLYVKISAPRGGAEQMVGSTIVRADLTRHTEEVVSKCGSCWSLAVIGEEFAVLKSDGVWTVSTQGGELRQRVKTRGLQDIIGPVAERTGWLLVAARRDEPACEFRLETLDLATSKQEPLPEGTACLTEGDLGALVKPGAVRAGQYLSASEPGPDPIRLLVAQIRTSAIGPRPPNQPVLPWLKGQEERVNRFAPVWLTDTSIAYLRRDKEAR